LASGVFDLRRREHDVIPRYLTKREHVGLDADDREGDLEGAVGDGTRLPTPSQSCVAKPEDTHMTEPSPT
jgi:hypothetical protein